MRDRPRLDIALPRRTRRKNHDAADRCKASLNSSLLSLIRISTWITYLAHKTQVVSIHNSHMPILAWIFGLESFVLTSNSYSLSFTLFDSCSLRRAPTLYFSSLPLWEWVSRITFTNYRRVYTHCCSRSIWLIPGLSHKIVDWWFHLPVWVPAARSARYRRHAHHS